MMQAMPHPTLKVIKQPRRMMRMPHPWQPLQNQASD
jgi:hypothetical protein